MVKGSSLRNTYVATCVYKININFYHLIQWWLNLLKYVGHNNQARYIVKKLIIVAIQTFMGESAPSASPILLPIPYTLVF